MSNLFGRFVFYRLIFKLESARVAAHLPAVLSLPKKLCWRREDLKSEIGRMGEEKRRRKKKKKKVKKN